MLKQCNAFYLPLVQKLLIPWIIPKKEFIKFGISEKDIIHYTKHLDESHYSKRKITKIKSPLSLKLKRKRLFCLELDESQAAYFLKNRKIKIVSMIKKISKRISRII